ncbi:putative protein S-acyltransferase 17 [Diplonema papillatum]|nr:putative protein S-acyltransferase 17 [Diplonema papillatum]
MRNELALAYVLVVVGGTYALTMGQTRYHRDGFVGRAGRWLMDVPHYVVVAVVAAACCSRARGEAAAERAKVALFDERHPLMMWCYIAMTGGAVCLYYYSVFPAFLSNPEVAWWHVITAPLATLWALQAFILACYSDPGTLPKHALSDPAHPNAPSRPPQPAPAVNGSGRPLIQYPFDHAMYTPNNPCSTCNVFKPARSKHCKLCDRCVRKFDHHCGWLDNDVGEDNYVHFLHFLLSHLVLCGYGAWTCARHVEYFVRKNRLFSASFSTSDGQRMKATYTTIFQFVLQTHTVLCGELLFMGCVTVMMTAFLGYHLYLCSFNMTTNETFKLSDLQEANAWYSGLVQDRELQIKQLRESGDAATEVEPIPYLAPPPVPESTRALWRYNGGWFENFRQVLFPYQPKPKGGGTAGGKQSKPAKTKLKKR